MYTMLGLALAMLMAWSTMQAVAWLRRERGVQVAPRTAMVVGIVIGVGFALASQFLPAYGELVSGFGIGVGIGIAQGFKGEAK